LQKEPVNGELPLAAMRYSRAETVAPLLGSIKMSHVNQEVSSLRRLAMGLTNTSRRESGICWVVLIASNPPPLRKEGEEKERGA
jgi:hypothetical protein